MTFQETPRRALESGPVIPEHYERRDILTGTQQVIIDRDLLSKSNTIATENMKLLRDIRKMLGFTVPSVQYEAKPSGSPSVDNVRPLDIYFYGNGNSRSVATLIALAGGADFFYDFDRDASINSPRYSFSLLAGSPIYIPVQVQRVSLLATAAGPFYVNAFATQNAPNANYIAVRAWGAPEVIDDARI